jgi:hypothetical protein
MLFYKKIFLHYKISVSNHYSTIPQHNNMFGLNWYGVNKYSFAVDVFSCILNNLRTALYISSFLWDVRKALQTSYPSRRAILRHNNTNTHTHKFYCNRVNAEFSKICPNFWAAESKFVRSRIPQ